MSPEDYQLAVLERLDALFVLATAFSAVVILLLAYMAVSSMGRR